MLGSPASKTLTWVKSACRPTFRLLRHDSHLCHGPIGSRQGHRSPTGARRAESGREDRVRSSLRHAAAGSASRELCHVESGRVRDPAARQSLRVRLGRAWLPLCCRRGDRCLAASGLHCRGQRLAGPFRRLAAATSPGSCLSSSLHRPRYWRSASPRADARTRWRKPNASSAAGSWQSTIPMSSRSTIPVRRKSLPRLSWICCVARRSRRSSAREYRGRRSSPPH